MASAGEVNVIIRAKDEVTANLRKAGESVRRFGKLTDDQMRKVEKSSQKLSAVGKRASAMGRTMTTKMTLPMAAAGAAAFKMASDFESSMTRIQSLVGLSAEAVEGFEKDVLRLSGETARAPKELADAMFFVTSAGIRGAEATDVLAASAKAAAVGLGDTATIADLATSALNAYGSDVISATDATDVMVAAVREGKLEADELAGSMGRVLPVASSMGVNFNEVGAAFASMSRTGTNANEAATQLRSIMVSLLKPTKDAEEALAGMGLSSEGLRTQMREEGLLATLQTLSTEFDGNADAAASVFGNVRALVGVMDLMGANAESTSQIFANMADTTGTLDKAFGVASQTTEFKLNAALSEFKVAMIAIGKEVIPVVLPMLQSIAEFIGKVVKAFSNLSGPMKTVIVVVGLMVAALGPLLMILGLVGSAAGALGVSVAAMLGPIGLAIAAVGALAFVFMKLTAVDKEAQSRQQALNEELKAAGDPTALLADKTASLTAEYERLAGAQEKAVEVTEEFNGSSVLLGELLSKEVVGAFEDLELNVEAVDKATRSGTDEFQRMAGQAKLLRDDHKRFADVLRTVEGEASDVTSALADQVEQELISVEAAGKVLAALDETADAYDDNNKLIAENAKETLTNTDNQIKYAQIIGGPLLENIVANAKKNDDWTGAQQRLNTAIAATNADLERSERLNHGLVIEQTAVETQVEETTEAVKEQQQTWQELKDWADRSTIDFELALDTTGLYEQLNEAMNAIVDLGSLMPGGDSTALNAQLAIGRRISEKLIDTKKNETKAANDAARAAAKASEAAHKAAMAEAERAFNKFVNDAVGLGGKAISESFVTAIAGEPDDIKKAFKDLFDSAFKSGLTQIPELRSTFQKALEGQQALIDIAEQRANLNTILEHSEERLAAALENQASAQAKVNKLAESRASLASRTASAFGFEFGEDIGAKAQAERLLEQYTAFETNLKALQTKGFPTDIISQVIGLGAFAGNDAAEGLLAMGDTDFEAFTTALTGISAIGAKIGDIEAGMKFGGAQAAAQAGLLGATASAEGALAARDLARGNLTTTSAQATAMAQQVAGALATGIQGVLGGLSDSTDESAAAIKAFGTEIQAFLAGDIGAGMFDLLNNPALGEIPKLLADKSFTAKLVKAPIGTKTDPIVVTDPAVLEAVKAGLTPAQQFNVDTASAQAINRRVTEMAGGAGFAEADAASLGIANSLRKRAQRTNETYGIADAASMGLLGSGRGSMVGVDALPGGVVINVQGSIVTEKEIIETVRQGALENQRSGKSWSVDVL
jgi:TP901 family phage tail tape measure protein